MDYCHVTSKESQWILNSHIAVWNLGYVKGETESTIAAAQNQATSKNYFKNKIFEEETETKCQLCKRHEETIDHLASGCTILVKNEYSMRHDKFCANFHYSICKALGIGWHTYRNTHMPKPVYEEGDITLLWKQYLEQHTQYRKYCSVKLEDWAVGITAGSREVPERKGLWQETSIITAAAATTSETTTTTTTTTTHQP